MAETGERRVRLPVAPVDLVAELAAALEPLAGEGFQIAEWSVMVFGRANIPIRPFITVLKVLTNKRDPDMFVRLVGLGNRQAWWPTVRLCTPIQLFSFCVWLNSYEGTTAINVLRRDRQLERRTHRRLEVDDVALVSAFREQIADMDADARAIRLEQEEFMAEIRYQMALKNREFEDQLQECTVIYRPAAIYQEMDEIELTDACFGLYHDECVANNDDEAEPTPENVDAIRLHYSNEAKSLHMASFLCDERRREELKVWIEERVLELSETRDFEREKTFHSYLSAISGEVATEVGAEVEARTSGPGGVWRARRQRRPQVDVENVRPTRLRRRTGQDDAGTSAQTAAVEAGGAVSAGAEAPVKEPVDHPVERTAPPTRRAHRPLKK